MLMLYRQTSLAFRAGLRGASGSDDVYETANLRAEVKKRIAQIESMTLVQIQWFMMDCMSERSAGRMKACEGNARHALNKRVSILGRDLVATRES
ncbi:hypothetical protein [Bradyrhizobium sp. th.b2]|uniref:hypothetical protein n=1 Tax=Bradyrhizobium sp. th-b2 TaxID=172088 RepID=UPI000491952E|nr:hypothetical protein [Bradyrhizobium sp. th.b2]